jgi:hypothetical protein
MASAPDPDGQNGPPGGADDAPLLLAAQALAGFRAGASDLLKMSEMARVFDVYQIGTSIVRTIINYAKPLFNRMRPCCESSQQLKRSH